MHITLSSKRVGGGSYWAWIGGRGPSTFWSLAAAISGLPTFELS